MFKLFSRSRPSSDPVYRQLKADMHSHLIPGIDDGAPDMNTSLQLIKGMMELGYSRLVTTPHILWDMYKNGRENILSGLQSVQEAVHKEGWPVEIHAAAEYFLDDHVQSMIKNKEPLMTIGGNMVLVEFSLAYPSHSLKDILFDMQMQGYQPVIAHPERYIYLQKNKDFYEELKDIGCLFQLNVLSITNHYGKGVNDLAHYLLKKEYYDLIGTDLHHTRHLEALRSPSLILQLKKILDSGKIRNAEL